MKTATILLALAFGFTACSASTDGQLPTQEGNSASGSQTSDNQAYSSLISKTAAYPASYAEEAEHRGRIERIDYDTRDYAEGTGRRRTNTAYVYLPYGYDDSGDVRYNVVYLVHGHYGTASTTFEAEGGLQRKVLDHMTFHEKDGARHEFLPTPEYVYNALPFFFPPQNATGIKTVGVSKKSVPNKSYGIDGRLFTSQGIVIENGKKILARHYE